MKYGADRTETRMNRKALADKYDLKEILYGLRELYNAIKGQPEIEYEVSSLRRAIVLLTKWIPHRAKKQEDGSYQCPHCGFTVDNYYCPECGQTIFWKWNIRPNDERRIDKKYHTCDYVKDKTKDMLYINLQERREIDWYIRIRGLHWVLEKLSAADSTNDPIDRNEIRDRFRDSQDDVSI